MHRKVTRSEYFLGPTASCNTLHGIVSHSPHSLIMEMRATIGSVVPFRQECSHSKLKLQWSCYHCQRYSSSSLPKNAFQCSIFTSFYINLHMAVVNIVTFSSQVLNVACSFYCFILSFELVCPKRLFFIFLLSPFDCFWWPTNWKLLMKPLDL